MNKQQKQRILQLIEQQAIVELEQQVDEGDITDFNESDIEQAMENLIDDCQYLIEPILDDVLGENNWDDFDAVLNELYK